MFEHLLENFQNILRFYLILIQVKLSLATKFS
jgi:hypothetical protein